MSMPYNVPEPMSGASAHRRDPETVRFLCDTIRQIMSEPDGMTYTEVLDILKLHEPVAAHEVLEIPDDDDDEPPEVPAGAEEEQPEAPVGDVEDEQPEVSAEPEAMSVARDAANKRRKLE